MHNLIFKMVNKIDEECFTLTCALRYVTRLGKNPFD